jgi:hypothetical protein
MYWNARGGSHTDGGAFIFNLGKEVPGKGRPLTCNNKFGARVTVPGKEFDMAQDAIMAHTLPKGRKSDMADKMLSGTVEQGYQLWKQAVLASSAQDIIDTISSLSSLSENSDEFQKRIDLINIILDRRYPTGKLRRARITTLLTDGIALMLRSARSPRQRWSTSRTISPGSHRTGRWHWRSIAPGSRWKGKKEFPMSYAGQRSWAGRR